MIVLAGVLLTHAHIGHYTGLMFIGYESMSARRLPVYVTERMAAFLTGNGPWSQLVRLENIALRTFKPDERFRLTDSLSAVPFQVPHRDEFSDTMGFRISGPLRSLLYIPASRGGTPGKGRSRGRSKRPTPPSSTGRSSAPANCPAAT